MRVWISAILIASLAGALHAGNWPGHDGSHVAFGGDRQVLTLNTEAGPMVEGGEVEFAFVRLMRDSGADVLSKVGRIKLNADRNANEPSVDADTNRESGVVYGFGMTALTSPLALGNNVLRQMLDDISLSGALPALDRLAVRVWFGF